MTKIANNSSLHLTLRELQTQLQSKQFAIWIIVAIVILTVAGPFGTLERFNTLERLAYWLIITPTTYLLASFSATLISTTLMKHRFQKWVSYAIAGIIAGLPVGIFVWFFTAILHDNIILDLSFLLSHVTQTMLITLAVTMLFGFLSKDGDNVLTNAESNDRPKTADLFLNRLPKKLGRDIISLQAQDHYIEVKTTLGSELLLMRISDAISELANINGFQTHRSWWVAKKHIIEVQTNDGKKYLELTDKSIIPVSRSYAKNIKNPTNKPDH